MLRQSAHVHPHARNAVKLIDAVLRNDVDHARRKTGIRHYTHTLGKRFPLKRFLRQDDLGVPTKVGEVYARLHR